MKISDSEMELMRIIWPREGEITSAELIERLKDTWKPTTVMTFLKRLCDKEILSVRKDGKINLYSAKVTEDEYKRSQTEEFLRDMHKGSVTSLLAALFKGKQPDSKEMSEIKKWFDEL